MSWRRIKAVMMQNTLIMRRSPLRIMELLYWPMIEVVLWGFMSSFLAEQQTDIPGGVGILLGAVVMWDVMFRSQQELAVTYLIDVWDKNIINLYASPLRQSEYFIGGLLFSIVRVLVGTSVLLVFARLAFGFNILRAGILLVPAFVVLVGMGWVLGWLIRAAVLRYGTSAEVLAWSLAFLFQPISAVFYPVSTLPPWLQKVAFFIPASHVFEALRAWFERGELLLGRLAWAGLLDLVYLAGAGKIAAIAFHTVRERGLLTRPGY